LEPAPDNRIVEAGQISQGLVAALPQTPVRHLARLPQRLSFRHGHPNPKIVTSLS
jgi:hypothetical protein